MTRPKLSVCVAAMDEEDHIEACLAERGVDPQRLLLAEQRDSAVAAALRR